MLKFDLYDYDRYIVSFSGGKDSTSFCFISLTMVYRKRR